MPPRLSPFTLASALMLTAVLSLGVACDKGDVGTPISKSAEWVEDQALDRFQQRQTLYGLGKKVSELYELPPIITSRDPTTLAGPEDKPCLQVIHKPMARGDQVLLFHGDQKVFERPLTGRDQAFFSPHCGAVGIYQGLTPPLGEPWTPGTDVEIYVIGKEGSVKVPRGDALSMGSLLDDGTFFMVDGPGVIRRYGPDGKLAKTLTLKGVHPSKNEPGKARSTLQWLPAQGLIAVTDYAGPSNRMGRRIRSGVRLFSMTDGSVIATHPSGIEVIGGKDDPEHYFLLEKPGKLVRFKGGKRLGEGLLPGRGELAISPDGAWVTITGEKSNLWLFDTGIMSGVWEHTSPEPWNSFIAEGTRVYNGGRVFGARRELTADGLVKQMQLFSLEADGSGKVLLERPYQDASLPPVWITGATDNGRKVMFGALGEELRVLDFD